MEWTYKCPRCNKNNWEINNEHETCYCLGCHGFFGQNNVKKFWEGSIPKLSRVEEFASRKYVTKKPTPDYDENGQYPYRCPICRTKHLYKDAANDCINRCWKEVKETRKKGVN